MATDGTFSPGQGKPCNSPGSEPPQLVTPQGTQLENIDCDAETWHLKFRSFTCSEGVDPIEDLQRLTWLCQLWLRPDRHTTEQILDQLVLEQFLISTSPHLQALVKENGVRSCRDLEDVLRNNTRPKKWSIVTFQGQEFLVPESDAEMADAEASGRDDVVDLSSKHKSSMNHTHVEVSLVCSEFWASARDEGTIMGAGEYEALVCEEDEEEAQEKLSIADTRWYIRSGGDRDVHIPPIVAVAMIPLVTHCQGEDLLLPETLSGEGDLESVRPRQTLEKDLEEDRKEETAIKSQEPQHPQGPGELKTWPQGGQHLINPWENHFHCQSSPVSPWPEVLQATLRLLGVIMLQHSTKGDKVSLCLKNNKETLGVELVSPTDSVRANDGKEPQQGTCLKPVDAVTRPLRVSEREVSPQSGNGGHSLSLRRSKRRKMNSTSTFQEGPQGEVPHLDSREPPEQDGWDSAPSPCTGGPIAHAPGREGFECGECSKKFPYESQLLIHQRTHSGERPFTCSCGKGFLQPSDLRVHQRIHTGEKPYKCDICDKRFTHQSTLYGHERIHTKERPYSCKFCKKSFSHKGNLNVHHRIHLGLRPFECSVCKATFRQLGTFKRHLAIHSKTTSC
ncbi:zinc finger and SCAN domain-containing protein 5B-like [Nycticebus coucang]|uniref:zinc finger and SCAN domain-containing protein 5B-like n=1 Tax=Nycticebus coucang TaxID=9470 RepID=UPI00234D02D8|nr:zinc finger and SCAN domain-containing protein 5B-like [Nycticebus coucang]